MAEVAIFNKRQNDLVSRIVEDITKFHIKRDGWNTTMVEKTEEVGVVA